MVIQAASNTKQHEAVAKAIDALRWGDISEYKEHVTEEDGDEFVISAYWVDGKLHIDIDCVV